MLILPYSVFRLSKKTNEKFDSGLDRVVILRQVYTGNSLNATRSFEAILRSVLITQEFTVEFYARLDTLKMNFIFSLKWQTLLAANESSS